MNRFTLIIILLLPFQILNGQCLTDFTKLVPESSIDYSSDFGRSVAFFGNYMAVGIPFSDSLKRLGGIVYMYEKINTSWKKITTFVPSNPLDGMQFGFNMALSENYLLVSSFHNGGKVHVFKKSNSGWSAQPEINILQVSNSYYFGCNPYNMASIVISEDEQTVAITDVAAPVTSQTTSPYYMGAVYIFHKQIFQDWNSPIIPSRIIAPSGDIADFGRGGVALKGNHVITGSPYTVDGGNIFIFYDPSGTFSNYTHQATLRSENDVSYFLGSYNMVFADDGIFALGSENINDVARYGIIYFKAPPSGIWIDAKPTCFISITDNDLPIKFPLMGLSTNGANLLVSGQTTSGTGYFNLLTKGQNGWCNPEYETLDVTTDLPHFQNSPYGIINRSNQDTDAVLGFFSIPENEYATIALKTFSKDNDEWVTQLIHPNKKSTAGHLFGRSIVGYNTHLFVGTPEDGTNLPGVGAVYYYEKQGDNWLKKAKILSPSRDRFDDWFGSALATNKSYLAVGAVGYESEYTASGRVFIYKRGNTGWESSELVQEIALPEDELTVYSYGDNLAMDNEWLVIPYVQNDPYRIMMAIYRFDGSQWIFFQSLEAGFGNFFARNTTLAVSIDSGTLLAGSSIFERNQEGLWELKYILSPSDPENLQISPDFTYLVRNGSMFGHSNSIKDNTIFIGAPLKDHEDIWDVGAVYVYTKKPGEMWTSTTETAKLIPRIKEEGELFGYSIKNLGNTLLAGAPGNDYLKDGSTPRNKPGRAYVFQSKDYYWQDVIPLLDFTGDSFEKDYYGLSVYMDESDFFIGATIEDIETGQLSGSVYVTPSPPIIKLVPPVCSSENVIDLFGYPFGGTWTGPGILNATEGTFDPKVAGKGFHEFRYQTPSCAYEGILRVQVQDPPQAKLVTNTQLWVCVGTDFALTLSVEKELDVFYSWYFRAGSDDEFEPLEQRSHIITATSRGEYKLKVYTESCTVYTPTITISDETIDIETSIMEVCEKSTQPIPLTANPTGGTWTGPGITNNNLIAGNLPVGIYEATYHYISSIGCDFTTKTQIAVIPAPIPVISRQLGNLCVEGEVVLSLNNTLPGVLYSWFLTHESETGLQNGNSTSLTTNKNGVYTVKADYGLCEVSSPPFAINDQLPVTLSPNLNYAEICYGTEFTLVVNEPRDADFTWLYGSTIADLALTSISGPEIDVDKTGYYQLIVNKGSCEYIGEIKNFKVFPKDSTYVPNVFTPNGDGENEIFKMLGTPDDAQLSVFNRYGKLVFNGSSKQGWDGNGANEGVYFWIIKYFDCNRKPLTIKGNIQLIR
jgi:gliding motility-associated-like protein